MPSAARRMPGGASLATPRAAARLRCGWPTRARARARARARSAVLNVRRAHALQHLVHRGSVGEERDDLEVSIAAEHLPLQGQRDLANRDLEDVLEHRVLTRDQRAALCGGDV